MVIANAVYAIPKMPNNENGANDRKSCFKHNGNNNVSVKPNNVGVRDDVKSEEKVSPKIIE